MEINQRFITYISPLPPSAFHKVFGRGPVQGVPWDKLEYRSASTDLLGAKASHVHIFALDCLDPDKFGDIEFSVPNAVDSGDSANKLGGIAMLRP